MPKEDVSITPTPVRDSESGRMLTLRGAGALKGHLMLKKSVDLTKPIASQAIKGMKRHKAVDAPAKH